MWISRIDLTNVKAFKKVNNLKLSRNINVLVGPNNSGKSTIINSILLLQKPDVLTKNDVRIGAEQGTINLYVQEVGLPFSKPNEQWKRIYFDIADNRKIVYKSGSDMGFNQFPEIEPNNRIYPYLSKRKSVVLDTSIGESSVNSVMGNFTHLNAKVDRLITQQQPGHDQYISACRKIIGFEISSRAIGNGKHAVYFVHNQEYIPLSAMGDGVANILGLITDLCISDNKIFLIEELENDIHPNALKSLMDLIIEKSQNNQFIISTHSNIVMKHFGANDNVKIFRVYQTKTDKEMPNLFISKIEEVEADPHQRRKVLEDLGYDLFDFDLWKGWLFLEESSAESIIRDYLIRWFAPQLKGRLRTFSANGVDTIKQKFGKFNELFVFLHLEPIYKNKVWVLIDGGPKEAKIIKDFKSMYKESGWEDKQFNQFSKHDFELYYPNRFKKEVKKVLKMRRGKKKQEEKRILLNKVKKWIGKNDKEAKEAFKTSAKEVIEYLKTINKELNKSGS